MMQDVRIGENSLAVVESLCYLGDVCGQSGGVFNAVTGRSRSAWKAFYKQSFANH